VQPSVDQPRGQYTDAEGKKRGGIGGVLLILGIAVGVYALSPGARHYYKHGHLPPYR
jgi:hypothetical protein